MQRCEVQILVLVMYFVIYLSIFFSGNSGPFLPIFEHKYMYFILLTFSKQACYSSWNAF